MFVSYEQYAKYFKWLTLVLLSYVAVLFVVKVDWGQAGLALVMPQFPLTGDSFTVMYQPLPAVLAKQPGSRGNRKKAESPAPQTSTATGQK